MKKLSIVDKYLLAALALAAFTAAGVAPTLAQSSNAWSAGSGNVRPLVHALPADRSGYSAYGQAPASTAPLRPNNWSPFIGPEIWGH